MKKKRLSETNEYVQHASFSYAETDTRISLLKRRSLLLTGLAGTLALFGCAGFSVEEKTTEAGVDKKGANLVGGGRRFDEDVGLAITRGFQKVRGCTQRAPISTMLCACYRMEAKPT
jgi:hypothetical protein